MNLAKFNIFQIAGHVILRAAQDTGRSVLFLRNVVVQGLSPPYYPRMIFWQMVKIGYTSLPVVGLTAFFTRRFFRRETYSNPVRMRSMRLGRPAVWSPQ